MMKSIELDCAPGSPRPGDLIGYVIEGTGLKEKEPAGKFFGNWVWEYPEVDDAEWRKIQPTLKERVTSLYSTGRIRYGSW